MTMFKKVFGSQMAASEAPPQEVTPQGPVLPKAAEQPATPKPNSQPLFAPLPQVLRTREEEMAALRAERDADMAESLLQSQKKPVAPRPLPEPVVMPAPVVDTPAAPMPQATPAPAPAIRPAGRARTRLLGFTGGAAPAADPMSGPVAAPQAQQFPTGWIVVADGPGRGHFFALFNGVSTVGRDENQAIALAFGDMTISRENHAAIAYDNEDKQFYVGHGGKSNIIRLNGRPVLSTEPLTHGDSLRIGETVLRFVALCGADFEWADSTDE